MKHIKSILLTLLVTLLALPGVAQDFEYEGIWYTVLDSDAKTVKTKEGYYDPEIESDPERRPYSSGNKCEGEVTIPAIVSDGTNDYTVVEIGAMSFVDCTGLTSINIPDGLTIIGRQAFHGCSGLTTLKIPDSVTSIGLAAFCACTSLSTINIPDGVTSIEKGTFSVCKSLSSINIPNGVTIIDDEAFYCCGITSINIPYGVTSIGESAFSECGYLTSIVIPESMQSIGYEAFVGIDPNAEITYLAENPIESYDNIFSDESYSLGILNMPNATLAYVQAIGPWNNFQHIIAKDGSIEPDLAVDEDFEFEGIWYTVLDAEAKTVKTKDGGNNQPGNNCEGDVTIPAIVMNGTNDYTVVEIGEYGFWGCSSLTSINIPDGVTSIGEYAFWECRSLTSLTLPDSLTSIGLGVFGACSELTSINIPDGVTSIGEYAFRECRSLTSLTLPDGLTSIGSGAFGGCSGLTTIHIPDGVKSIEESTFLNCSSLISITLPDGVTSIASGAFGGCSGLTSIALPEGVTSIGSAAFGKCSGLTSITLPDGVTSIEESTFYDCSSLTSVNIPDGVTSIGSGAFGKCSGLTSIKLPDGLTSIGSAAFGKCSSLTSINIPDGVTSIGSGAFVECPSVTSVSIPASIISIEEYAFMGIDPNAEITYLAENPIESYDNIFSDDSYSLGILNMPNATLADIQAIVPWTKFQHIVAKEGSQGKTVLWEADSSEGDPIEGWHDILSLSAEEASILNMGDIVTITVTAKATDGGWPQVGLFEGGVVWPPMTQAIIEDCPSEIKFGIIHDIAEKIHKNGVSFKGDDVYVSEISYEHSSIDIGPYTVWFGPKQCNWGDGVSVTSDAFANVMPGDKIVVEYDKASPQYALQIWLGGWSGWNIASYEASKYDFFTIDEEAGSMTIDLIAALSAYEVELDGEIEIFDAFSLLKEGGLVIHGPCIINQVLFINQVQNVEIGDNFEYEGIWYTVIDAEAKTVKTKEGVSIDFDEIASGNVVNGDLIIPSVVSYDNDSYTVVEIGALGFTGTDIMSVSFPETISKIGAWAFANCDNLTSVSIPEDIQEMDVHAFRECMNLVSVHLPKKLTRIPSYLFTGCESLSEINIPESLISIGDGTFNFCAFTSLELPEGFKTFGDTGFNGNPIKTLTLPASITEIGSYVFLYCRDLEVVNYLAENPVGTASTTFSEEAYEQATLNMPNATLAAVQATTPWNLFKRIKAKDGSIGFITDGDDFEYEGLLYTVIDSETKTCKTKEGHGGVVGVTAGNTVEGALIIPESVSFNDDKYKVIGIGAYGFAGNKGITSISLPKSVNFIDEHAFFNCEGVESISFSSDIDSIGERAFSFCTSLTSVTLPYRLVRLEVGLFQGCHNLKTVVLPSGLITIGLVAFESSGVENVTFPETLETIEEGAFAQCPNLKLTTLPSTVKYLGRIAFFNCNLTSISIPENVEFIGDQCFATCHFERVDYAASSLLEVNENVFNENAYQNAVLNTPNATLAAVQATVPWNKFLRINASDGSIVPFVTEVTLSKTTAELKIGETVTLEATVIPENATDKTVTWKSDNESVATVDSDGMVTAIALGETTITATCGPVSATCKVSVVPTTVESVTLSNTSLNLSEGEITTLTATVSPVDATDKTVTWKTSDLSVATVSESGVVTAVKEGTATITATSTNGKTATCTVTVASNIVPVASISISDTELILTEGDSATLTATVTPDDATDKTVTWTSSDASVATVSSNGEVTAIKAGTATITASSSNGKTATCTVTVSAKIIESTDLTLSQTSAELKVGDTVTLKAIVIPEDATDKTITWTSSDTSVATVSANGEVTAIKVGTATITASTSNGKTATCTVTVADKIIDPTDLTLSQTVAELKVGETISLKATVIPEDATDKTVTWKSDNEGVATVDSDGKVTAISIGEAIITATCGQVNATCKVTVVPTQVESVTLSNTSLDLIEGDMATLTATVAPADATDKTVTWTSSDVSVATVSESGEVTAVKVGTATITATSTNGKSATCTVTVAKKGNDFEFEGIWYTVIDPVANTCRTKSGDDGIYSMFDEYPSIDNGSVSAGNHYSGTLVIPDKVSDGVKEYEVVEIGFLSFFKNNGLTSVELPSSVSTISSGAFCGCTSMTNISMQNNLKVIGSRAFEECGKLTSLIWTGDSKLQKGVVEGIGNPNLLVYVDDTKYAPEGIDHNIVADGICDNLVLTPGYAFTPIKAFAAEHSEITKEFTQLTPIGGCAGWETLAIPFEPTEIIANDGRQLVPFSAFTDIITQCPFWLYEADAAGEWKEASAIHQGVPYLVSMPDNDSYDPQYCIHGAVKFSTDDETIIAPETTAPYVTTWATGREFRSLWLPLDETEAANAMGLNVGIDDLTNDQGDLLASGSAFHADVLPRPLEAYVTRIDGRRFMPVRGEQSFVKMISGGEGLRIAVDFGKIILSSDSNRIVDVLTMDGVILRHANVKAGEAYVIDNLTRGIYIVAGRKITVK